MENRVSQCREWLHSPLADRFEDDGELNERSHLFEQHVASPLPYPVVAYLMVETLFRARKDVSCFVHMRDLGRF